MVINDFVYLFIVTYRGAGSVIMKEKGITGVAESRASCLMVS